MIKCKPAVVFGLLGSALRRVSVESYLNRSVISTTMAVSDAEFPVIALLPKKETGVLNFLAKNPTYDGRGVTIAILDSGIDPGAPGMQVTSDGKVKIVETYDCSGAGDVDVSTVTRADEGVIKGLTGRELKIPPTWKNPTGKYHIGVKNAYELYLPDVQERVEKHLREQKWDPPHRQAIADVMRKIQVFEKEFPNKATLKGLDKLKREDLDSKLEALTKADKKYVAYGPTYDCVVFHDGDIWRACIDTSEVGDLASCHVIGEYSKTYEYAQLTKADQLNYAINVWDEGKTLEIVSFCSSHGTHVAAIAAANFPDDPERNGVAPGAQIISLSIGDNRLRSMETGTALARSMFRIMQNTDRKIHVMNMSYGEEAQYTTSGRIIELMNELVDKYNAAWVCAGGNRGPASSTVSSPPDVDSNVLIGVGAYVSPEMMVAQYSLRQKNPGVTTTWTSRGPLRSGDPGISVCAPGAAITSVPQTLLRSGQLMNGTSMASPHVAGLVALLVSGMLDRKLQWTPYSIKRALENTAIFQDSADCLGQGQGLVQVEPAFEYLTAYSTHPEWNVRFNLSCGPQAMRGIYIRDRFRDKPEDISVLIEPVFHNSSSIETNACKTNFRLELVLVCDEVWVSHPSRLCITNSARNISIRIDPTVLSSGIHSTNIKAYDSRCIEKGPVFRIPITVVQPVVIPSNQSKKEITFNNVHFKPCQINRHFISVPEDATYAVIRLFGSEKGNYKLHKTQHVPHNGSIKNEFEKLFSIIPNTPSVYSFSVQGGVIMELVVAKYWVDPLPATLDYSVSFHGVKPDREQVIMNPMEGIFSMNLYCGLNAEEIAPSVTLKNVVSFIRPTEAKIVPLSPTRDMIPPNRQVYELQLSYKFSLNKSNEVSAMCPFLGHLLYESEYESQLWMLFNNSKQYITCGDLNASKNPKQIKLEKGDYVIRMHVRHEKQDLLQKLNEKPLLITQKLPSAITLDVYRTEPGALTGERKIGNNTVGKKLVSGTVSCYQKVPIYIPPISNDKINKAAQIGQYLTGSISYVKDELGKKAAVYPFKYILEPFKKSSENAENSSKESSNNNNSSSSNNNGNTATDSANGSPSEQDASKDKEPKDKLKMDHSDYLEALLELKTSCLSKLETSKQAQTLYEELKTSNPENLSVHLAMLGNLKKSILKNIFPVLASGNYNFGEDSLLSEAISVSDRIIQLIDQNALLAYYGIKNDMQPDAAKLKTQMDKQKAALVEALGQKGVMLCQMYLSAKIVSPGDTSKDGDEKKETPTLDEIDALYNNILKFIDTKDSAFQPFAMWHAAAHGHLGRFFKIASAVHQDKPTREQEQSLVAVLRMMEFDHWAKNMEDSVHVRYPPSYRPF